MYTKTLGKLEELAKFLDTYDLPKVKPEDIRNLNRPLVGKDSESVINSPYLKKSLGLDGFTGEVH